MALSLIRTFLLVLAAYAFGLWLYAVPFVGDQKVYLATAMEMWQRESWLHPYLMGETSYFKPPWLYWTTLAGWKVFGFVLFGAFFPSALATALTAVVLDVLSRKVDWRQGAARPTSSLAGIWFAACVGTMTYGTTTQMEIWVVLFYAVAWWCFLEHYESDRLRWLVLGVVVAGVAAWNKSPLYSVFSVLAYWLYLAAAPGGKGHGSGRSARWWLLRPTFYLSHLPGVAAGFAWFAAIWYSDRERFWNHYVLQETLGKRGGNGSSPLTMWGDFLSFCVPFLLLLIPALARARGLGRQRGVFLLCWGLIPAAFFSYFPYRTETYLYILIPAVALLLDWTLEPRGGALLKWLARLNGLVVGLAVIGGAVFLGVAQLAGIPWVVILGVVGVVFLFVSWGPGIRGVALAGLALIFALRLCAIAIGEREVGGLRDAVLAQPDRPVAFVDDGRTIWHEIGLLSATIGKPGLRLYSLKEAVPVLRRGALLVLTEEQSASLLRRTPALLGPDTLARLRQAPWPRLPRRLALASLEDVRRLGERENLRQFRFFWLD
ncbi:MAG: glycosyltransferase family 39 protein [Oligoflexia bacterium]|nr:glycosyltransferase family 39 protein [Oligoflexia bacterium]